MAANKILLLRVGMDLGYGGLGPLFPGGSFEYVPIPDNPKKTSPRSLMFSQISARSAGCLEQYVPVRYRGGPAHYDPEFETFTYGDPTKNKRGQLLRLARNDLLVFYAGLRPPSQRSGSRLYLIGYFTVENVHNCDAACPWPPPSLQHLWANAHFRRKSCDPGLVVVEGAPKASRLLKIAIPLSDEQQEILPEMQRRLGLKGSVKRAGAGRWIPATHVTRVELWLRSLESGVSDRRAKSAEQGFGADYGGDPALDLNEDNSLIDELLASDPKFQALVAKSKAGPRKPFQAAS